MSGTGIFIDANIEQELASELSNEDINYADTNTNLTYLPEIANVNILSDEQSRTFTGSDSELESLDRSPCLDAEPNNYEEVYYSWKESDTNYFYKQIYESFNHALSRQNLDNYKIGTYSFNQIRLQGENAEVFRQGPGNVIYPNFSHLEMDSYVESQLSLEENKNYLIFELYNTTDLDEIDSYWTSPPPRVSEDLEEQFNFANQHSLVLHSLLEGFVPNEKVEYFNFKKYKSDFLAGRLNLTQPGNNIYEISQREGLLEHQIDNAFYELSDLSDNRYSNFIISPSDFEHASETKHVKIKFKRASYVPDNDLDEVKRFIPYYLQAPKEQSVFMEEFPRFRIDARVDVRVDQVFYEKERPVVPSSFQASSKTLEEINFDNINYNLTIEQLRSNKLYIPESTELLGSESDLGFISYLKSRNMQSFREVYEGLSCSATFVTEIEKWFGNEVIQTFYCVGDIDTFIDHQVKLNKEYTYKIYQHYLVYGSEINIGPGQHKVVTYPDSLLINTYSIFEYTNDFKIKIVRELIGELISPVIRSMPFLEPIVSFIPHKKEKNKISLYIENSNSSRIVSGDDIRFLYPVILEEDKQSLDRVFPPSSNYNVEQNQYYSEFSGITQDQPSEEDEEGYLFGYNPETGVEPAYFEIFRTSKRPLNYSDFKDSLHARISCKDSEGNIRSSFMFEDLVTENTKYWYLVRVVDNVGTPSLPTSIYQYEMIKENDVLIPTITSIDLNPLPKKEVVTAKKVVRISPRPEHVILGTDGEIQSSDFEWNSEYKIKMRSVKTGKKIDINFISTRPIKESIEQN